MVVLDSVLLMNLEWKDVIRCCGMLEHVLSRKVSQHANLVDTIQRLWLISDPVINMERHKGWPWCKCLIRGYSTRYCRENSSASDSENELFHYLTSE